MLRKLFGFLSWQMTLLVMLMFWAVPVQAAPPDLTGDITVVDSGSLEEILAAAITEAAQQLGSGGTLTTLFTSPAFVTILFSLLGALVTYFATNGVKLSSEWFKGRRTQILAGAISVMTAGVGGYFAIGEVSGAGGVTGAVLAGLAAVSSFLIAKGKHEDKRYQETGMRKPERKDAVSDFAESPTGQLAVGGLKALAKNLGLPGASFLVDALLSEHTLEEVDRIIRQMGRERALTEGEIAKDQDDWEKANAVPKGAQVLPTEPAPTQGGAL